MSLIVRLIGILLLSAGLAGLTYTTNLFDGVIATTQASFKMYPMSTDPPELKISDYLKNRIQTVHPDTRIPVIIELTAPTKTITGKVTGAMAMAQQAEILPSLQAYDFRLQVATHYVANMLAGTVPAKYVEEIAKDPNVKRITFDNYVQVLDKSEFSNEMYVNLIYQSVSLIDAPKVWEEGYTGNDVVVVIIDSGVDGTHKFLQRNGKSLELEEYSFFSISGYAGDHGTHCMGIIASQDQTYRGVAPGIVGYVDIIAISDDSTYLSYLIAAIDKAYSVAVKYKQLGYAVVSTNSWGIPKSIRDDVDSETLDKMRDAVMNLADTCPTVFSAGNEGSEGGIRVPADADRGGNEVITVGAINREGFVAVWSGKGPDEGGDEHNEPDVVAPGVGIVSTLPNNLVGIMSGTSMAAPHVAGIIALMLSKNPSLTNREALDALMGTAEDGGLEGFDYSYGAGIVSAYRAVNDVPGGRLPTTFPVGPIQIVSIVFTMLGFVMFFKPDEFIYGLKP